MTTPPSPDLLDEFEAGYGLGYTTGYDVGYSHGVADEGDAWSSIFTGVAQAWRLPRRADLSAARELSHRPCLRRCRRCSRCIHAFAYGRRGNRDYMGVEAERRMAGAGA